jgi:predicted ribosome quality control (RQC) complex YloA/Tae2 family protein
MNFDVFTLAAVVDELNDSLATGKIQDCLEIGQDAIGFEIYSGHRRQYLLISADSQAARLHLVDDKLRRGVETPSPLGLLLRRNVENARIDSFRQPPYERVVEMKIVGAEGTFSLIIEPMDRRSNILLVQDGMIMDCLRRIGPHDNRVRLSLPGHAYVPPPPQATKIPPEAVTVEKLADWLHKEATTAARPAWRILTETILGYSPMLAKETIYRAAGRFDAQAAKIEAGDLYAVIDEMRAAFAAHQWQPGVASTDGLINAYAVYEVTYLPGWRQMESINGALAAYYGAPIGIEAYDAAKVPVFAILNESREKVQRKVDSLRRSERDPAERERLQHSGELLLAYQYQIERGATSFSAQYDFDQPAIEIKLDPTLTPLENAKKYFVEYDHARRAMAEVPGIIKTTQLELDYLNQLHSDLTMAANWPEIGEVQAALHAGGYWRDQGQVQAGARFKGLKSTPIKVTTPEGLLIWVGRNARQNEDVTFTKGRPEDIWLHARGVPGSHVIIKTAGRAVPPAVLSRAASLAAYYSASRTEGHVLVDVTERRHVRKIKGGQPGMVTYRNESPIETVPRGE